MSGTVLLREFPAPPFDRREALCYAGAREERDERLTALCDDCFAELAPALSYRACYAHFPVEVSAGAVRFPFAVFESATLAERLCGCTGAFLFAATVGPAPDRLIARYGITAPARALLLQGVGAERAEALCDALCRDLGGEYRLRARFSPGYGDLPLSVQREFFRVLDCPRKIGLTLNESLLMSPSKSVTAIVGTERVKP